MEVAGDRCDARRKMFHRRRATARKARSPTALNRILLSRCWPCSPPPPWAILSRPIINLSLDIHAQSRGDNSQAELINYCFSAPYMNIHYHLRLHHYHLRAVRLCKCVWHSVTPPVSKNVVDEFYGILETTVQAVTSTRQQYCVCTPSRLSKMVWGSPAASCFALLYSSLFTLMVETILLNIKPPFLSIFTLRPRNDL